MKSAASADLQPVFNALKPVLAKFARRLKVKKDAPDEYALVTKSPSPFPQHKGHPMDFGLIRIGKSYVSFHLLPIYMDSPLNSAISTALKKRMQGKACFNFKHAPEPELLADLTKLIEASLARWTERKWL